MRHRLLYAGIARTRRRRAAPVGSWLYAMAAVVFVAALALAGLSWG